MPGCLVSPLSLFVFGCCVGAVFSLFFSFSGAGETQTPFRGFGIPLVSLLRGHALHPGPVRPARQLHLGYAPATAFFFLWSSSFAGLVVVGLGLSGLCLVGVHVRCLLHVMNVVRKGERHKTCRPPLLSLRCSRFFFGGREMFAFDWQPYCHTMFADCAR